MEEVHEEIGYWFVNVDEDYGTEYEYVNQYDKPGHWTMCEFNFRDNSNDSYLQLAVF